MVNLVLQGIDLVIIAGYSLSQLLDFLHEHISQCDHLHRISKCARLRQVLLFIQGSHQRLVLLSLNIDDFSVTVNQMPLGLLEVLLHFFHLSNVSLSVVT
jgi:hypothetical protein